MLSSSTGWSHFIYSHFSHLCELELSILVHRQQVARRKDFYKHEKAIDFVTFPPQNQAAVPVPHLSCSAPAHVTPTRPESRHILGNAATPNQSGPCNSVGKGGNPKA